VREAASIALIELFVPVHAFAMHFPGRETFELANLVDPASSLRANPDFPGADQHGTVRFERSHCFALKCHMALDQATRARDDESMLINHVRTGDSEADRS
jgi:hypothetical protein